MSEILTYKDAYKKAEEMDRSLNARDNLNSTIAFKHGDGSYCKYRHADFVRLSNIWFVIFTEHHGFHVYHFEDLEWVKKVNDEWLYNLEG